YYDALKNMTIRYGLMPEDVVFAGHVDWSELVAFYQSAHVLVSMSEHEVFCVPLIEAMICNTPILAYGAAAVPYTLGESGIQFDKKDYRKLAAIAHRLREDSQFRESILAGQRKQLQLYGQEAIEKSIDA